MRTRRRPVRRHRLRRAGGSDASGQAPVIRSFCEIAAARDGAIVVEDARLDTRFRDHPAIDALGIAAFAAVPLSAPTGGTPGLLCVIDRTPRRWTERELAVLHDLAAVARDEAQHRSVVAATDAVGRSSYDALPVMLWMVAPDGTCSYVNARWLEFTGRAARRRAGGRLDRPHSSG